MSESPPTAAGLEEALRRLDQIAVFVRGDDRRETWQFTFARRTYFLHFYPRQKRRFLRRLGSPSAAVEFANLKRLQELKIPAVRAAAMLSGLRFGNRIGDALLIHGLPEAQRLGNLLRDGDATAKRQSLLQQLIDILKSLGEARLGHTDLRPNSFLVDKNRLLFAEAAALVSGGLKTEHLWQLAHNAEPFATRADRLRVWASLVPEADLPHVDKRKMARYADNLRNDAVVPITIGAWSGTYRQRSIDAVPWSIASGMAIDSSQWLQAWPRLVERLAADRLDVLKRDRSGDVLAGQIELGEHLIDVIVKRPRNKFWYRYVLDCFRASRGRRTFDRTRQLQIRHLPVEYPLIVMERRVGGYVVESVDVFERVPGETLEQINLDRLTAKDRADLFFACGRLLRRIEETGLSHPDAKSSNWIVYFLPSGRPVPVLIDAYGVRPLRNSSQLKGIQRLLRAMRNHPQYTPDDSLQLCLGFAPRAKPEAAREN